MSGLRIAAFVLAGGEGARLRPLTAHLPKPALPFAAHCRVIDFVLENLRHSGVAPVYVLLQFKPLPLLQHLAAHWPQVHPLLSAHAFEGTADAVAQCLPRVDLRRVDIVAVLAADHVYRMDLRQMAAFHLAHGAGVTVAATPVPLDQADQFGILSVDDDGLIEAFAEKPACPRPMRADPGLALASMGNYMFAPQVLASAMWAGAGTAGFDFGRHVIPALVHQRRAYAYDFRRNAVPGVRPGEERCYWRDIGTLPAYAQAQHDAAGPAPRFALRNPLWPISATLAAAPADVHRNPAAADVRPSHRDLPGARVRTPMAGPATLASREPRPPRMDLPG